MARERHLHGSRATLARLTSNTCVARTHRLLLVFMEKRSIKNAFRLSEKRSLLKAVCPFPFAEEGRLAAIASDWRQLEEFCLLTQNVTQQQVGQAACAQAEQAVV